MAEKKTYTQKLQSPLWQQRRLTILNRDNWSCTKCQDKETQLHVHHKKYTGEPWEAPDDDLESLCKDCHKVITIINKGISFDVKLIHKITRSQYEKLFVVKMTNGTVFFLNVRVDDVNVISFLADDINPITELING